MTDQDGYPTEEELYKIKTWPYTDFLGLMEYVKGLWAYPTYWRVTDLNIGTMCYSVSTGGWSGNEDLINALQENRVFWGMCWYSSRRGGYHEFTVKPVK